MKTKHWFIIVLTVSLAFSISSFWNDSLIVDEIPHIGAGYSYWIQHDYRLNPEHPPLAKQIGTLPLLFLNLNQSAFQTKFWQTDVNGQWDFGRRLIFNSGNDAELITHLVKFPMLIFFILSALFIFLWGRKLYGDKAGLIAAVIFCFSPTILAHSRFVTTDVPALFGILFSTYYFVQYLKNQTRGNMIKASLSFGVALLLKFSTFLLVPFLGLVALIYGFISVQNGKVKNAIVHGFKSVLIFAIGFIVVVWPVYYFDTYNYPAEHQHNDTQYLLGSYGNRVFADTVIWLSDKPVLRAAGQYGLGLLMVNQRATGGNTTYFLGQVSASGWHYYFPLVYFMKEPLAWWGLLLIAVVYALWKRERLRFEEAVFLIWLGIYWTVSIRSNLNIGIRHLLPVYPFTILLVSGQLSKIQNSKIKVQSLSAASRPLSSSKNSFSILIFTIYILLGWYVVESVNVWPYYLTYFNETVGGPSGGYKYVVDSNLDWGQDLKRFSDYVHQNNIQKINLDYFGWSDPYYYLKDAFLWMTATKYKDASDFRAHNDSNGWIAVSATFLQGSANYDWLKNEKPITVIGHSIFVYHLQ